MSSASHVMRKLEQGLSGGVLATLPMTGVMLAAQRLGLMGEQPPAKITDAALEGVDAKPRPSERRMWTVLAHVGFGGGAGALFSLLRPGRTSLARAAIEGAVFGTGVWAASYAGWVPALGIMPPPTQDRPDRQLSMVLAHWVFGATLGLLVAARRRR